MTANARRRCGGMRSGPFASRRRFRSGTQRTSPALRRSWSQRAWPPPRLVASRFVMSKDGLKSRALSPTLATLYAGVALLGVAIGGHYLFPTADLVWSVLVVFGVLTAPQSLLLERSERRRTRR